jgi:hypothetical protein
MVEMKIRRIAASCLWMPLCLMLTAGPARAQDPAPAPAQPPAAAPAVTSDPDIRLDPLQPDFTLASLPTSLRLPVHKMSFRVTHRFTRPWGRGDFGDLLSDFFGFDSGAQIGLELRYGLLPGTQVGIYRTSDRTIQLFGQHSFLQEKPDGHPLSVDAIVTLEGLDNLRGQKSSTLGLIVSRKVGRIAALYVEPMFVANTNAAATGPDNTTMVGLGARVRIRPATYLVGEVTPRVAGYTPGVDQASFGIEMRAGGHTFQINFSNGLGTTLGQLTRSGVSGDSWFIGFNISRKFF